MANEWGVVVFIILKYALCLLFHYYQTVFGVVLLRQHCGQILKPRSLVYETQLQRLLMYTYIFTAVVSFLCVFVIWLDILKIQTCYLCDYEISGICIQCFIILKNKGKVVYFYQERSAHFSACHNDRVFLLRIYIYIIRDIGILVILL